MGENVADPKPPPADNRASVTPIHSRSSQPKPARESSRAQGELADNAPWPAGTVVVPVVSVSSDPAPTASSQGSPQGGWTPLVEGPPPGQSRPGATAYGSSSPGAGRVEVDARAPGARLLVDPFAPHSSEQPWEPPEAEGRAPLAPDAHREGVLRNDAPDGVGETARDRQPSVTTAGAVSVANQVVPAASMKIVAPSAPGASLRVRAGTATLIGVQPARMTKLGPTDSVVASARREQTSQSLGSLAGQRVPDGPRQHDPSLADQSDRRVAEPIGVLAAVRMDAVPDGSGTSTAIVAAGVRALLPPGAAQRVVTTHPRGLDQRADAGWQDAFATSIPAGRRAVVARLSEVGAPPTRPRLAMADAPDSKRAEAFRLLHHRLNASGSRTIAVATPRGGDEAAVCAAELALVYAEASPDPVLLVEADTQQPRLASVLGLTVEHCFALQLCDKHDGSPEPWRAVAVHHRHLHVMAVSPSLSGGDRLAPRLFHEGLSDLVRAPYAQIIVACPKVLDSADVALITGIVEGAVLAGAAGRTTVRDLRDATQQLAPTKVLGIALLQP
jgi:Mrp family chromosome partitioning ATPase